MGNKEILKHTTATNLLLRLFIGGFLIYMAYEILTSLGDSPSENQVTLIGFSVFFIICGVVIGANSLYRLFKRKYYDPMTSQDSEQVENQDENQQDNIEK